MCAWDVVIFLEGRRRIRVRDVALRRGSGGVLEYGYDDTDRVTLIKHGESDQYARHLENSGAK